MHQHESAVDIHMSPCSGTALSPALFNWCSLQNKQDRFFKNVGEIFKTFYANAFMHCIRYMFFLQSKKKKESICFFSPIISGPYSSRETHHLFPFSPKLESISSSSVPPQPTRKMSDYLPNEVIIDILKRLPADSLIRCRCVCKSWYSLISIPHFITTHLNFKA